MITFDFIYQLSGPISYHCSYHKVEIPRSARLPATDCVLTIKLLLLLLCLHTFQSASAVTAECNLVGAHG